MSNKGNRGNARGQRNQRNQSGLQGNNGGGCRGGNKRSSFWSMHTLQQRGRIDLLNHFLGLALVVVLLLSLAVRTKAVGHPVHSTTHESSMHTSLSGVAATKGDLVFPLNEEYVRRLGYSGMTFQQVRPAVWELQNGVHIYSSEPYGADIKGFAGATPVFIAIENGTIKAVVALPNGETPSFWGRVEQKGILQQWVGVRLKEVATYAPDVVSGASMSSTAVNQTIFLTLSHITSIQSAHAYGAMDWNAKTIVALLVLLTGLIVAFGFRRREYRTALLFLNVLVLGFWTGTFISISLLLNWLNNGVHLFSALVLLLMLVLAVVLPFLGKKNYYCMWVCPFGSAQELMGKLPVKKWRINPKTMQQLRVFRMVLFLVLVVLMWLGVAMDWVNYELFSAFLFESANTFVLIFALLFLLLSLVVHRPYCRTLCPTGLLLEWSQGIRTKRGKK